MTTYRKRKGLEHDAWHWCKNCSNYPNSNYEETTVSGRPSTGELCNECRAKERTKECL